MQNNQQEQNIVGAKLSVDSLKAKLAASKFLKIGVVILLIVVLALFIMPLALNNKALQAEIEKKVREVYGANFFINGDVRVALLPSPTIIIKDAFLLNYRQKNGNFDDEKVYNFYSQLIKIRMSFFGKEIEEVSFSNAILESYYFDRQPLMINEKFAAVTPHQPEDAEGKAGFFSLAELKQSDLQSIPSIVIKNSTMTLYDKVAYKKQFSAINLEMGFVDEKARAKGNFISEEVLNEIRLSLYFKDNSSDYKSIFSLKSQGAKLELKGNISSENRGWLSDFSGDFSADIADLKSFYNNFIDEEGLFAKKIKRNNKQVKIGAKVSGSNGLINVDNLQIDSDLLSGKGRVIVDASRKIPIIDIILNLEKFDLDDFWSLELVSLAMPQYKKDAAVSQGASTRPEQDSEGGRATIRNIDLTADISIKNAKYLNADLKDVSLYATVANHGQVLILPMMFKAPDGGSVWVSGVFDNDASPPRFVGKFSILGKNLAEILKWSKLELQNLKTDSLKEFRLHSDITLRPNGMDLGNLYLNIGLGRNEFLGSVKINGDQKAEKIVADFSIDDFVVENYFLISGQSSYFSPGLLIKKLFWLNSLSFDSSVNLQFDRLVYKDEEFFNQRVGFALGQGHFLINDLHLKSDKTDAKIDLTVDISNKDPKFELVASAANLHYENLADANNSKGSLMDRAIKSVSKNKSSNFIDQFYSLPSLEGFKGKVEFDFANLKLDGFKIKNAKFISRLKDGTLSIDDSSGELYNGSFSYKGWIGLKMNKIINGNLSLKNVAIKPLLSDLFDMENIDGVANISSSISSLASKKEDFFESFNGDVKFNANAPVVLGYGLNDLISKMFYVQSNTQELSYPERVLFNKNAATVFKDANGAIQINNGGAGIFKINTAAVAANGILSGNIDVKNRKMEALYNVIFLTGSRDKQVPINIAGNIKGDLADLSQNTNLDQVRQYLGLPVSQKTILIDQDNQKNAQENSAQ